MFADRHDAGRRLADRLIGFKNQNPVVLALPRGGVAVGVEIAIALKAPLDLVLVRKIGVPWQPELALGAVGAQLREVDLVGVGQPDLDAVDVDFFCRRCHYVDSSTS